MKILVLGGGTSPEREISQRSAAAVAAAARTAGYEVEEADPAQGLDVLEGLDPDTIVLPILHGVGGEDGMIQSVLEQRSLRYLGTNSRQSVVCFNKLVARAQLAQAGLPVAKGDAVTVGTYADHPLANAPHVLKVACGGSSIGTYMVHDPKKVDKNKVAAVFALDEEAVLEELVEGTEITVPVLGNTALPVIEIHPPAGSDFDFENKYNGDTEEICPPTSLSEAVQSEARNLAMAVHKTLGAKHLSRVDIIIRPNGEMVVLELNTVPGMTGNSLFPKSAKVAGMDMPALVKEFVTLIKKEDA
jgi:D-alanine-D-alanine ligase